jgi:hypothetical protein
MERGRRSPFPTPIHLGIAVDDALELAEQTEV